MRLCAAAHQHAGVHVSQLSSWCSVVLACSFFSPEDFEKVADYMITKPELCGRVLSIEHPGLFAGAVKVLGYPVLLQNEKYQRNSLLFSIGAVVAADADAGPYHGVLQKLGHCLQSLEAETEFLFKAERKARLARWLPSMLHGLNTRGECLLPIDSCDTLPLKLFPTLPDPPAVRDHDVPVRVRDLDVLVGSGEDSGWDLGMRMMVPHIDGIKYARAIAECADLDASIVRKGLQHLLYYGLIVLVDTFQYSNIYATTNKVQALLHNPALRAACADYVTGDRPAEQDAPGDASNTQHQQHAVGPASSSSESTAALAQKQPEQQPADITRLPSFESIFRLYTSFGAGARVCDVCAQKDTASNNIDDRRFVVFGVMHGLLRRIHKYPVPRPAAPGSPSGATVIGGGASLPSVGGARQQALSISSRVMPALPGPTSPSLQQAAVPQKLVLSRQILQLLDGSMHLEALCCKLGVSQFVVESAIDAHGGFVYVLR